MIVSTVTAIAIAHREARRENARRQAEAEAAAKKTIVIVGAGLAGVTAALLFRHHGFTVSLLEQAEEEVEVPEVVRLHGNALKILHKVEGLRDELEESAIAGEHVRYHSGRTGKQLHRAPLAPITTLTAPATLLLAYNDLHALLLERAEAADADVRYEDAAVGYFDAATDLDGPLPHGRPYVLTADDERVYGDLIFCCDGRAGLGRAHVAAQLEGADSAAEPARWWRWEGSVEGLRERAETRELVQADGARVWIGRRGWVEAASAGEGEEWIWRYTTSAPPPAPPSSTAYFVAARPPTLPAGEFPAAVRAGVAATAKAACYARRLTALPLLPSWYSKKTRKLILGGDAAHEMPWPTHEAYSCLVEDVSCLSACLKKAASVPLGLEIYSRLRRPRVEAVYQRAKERLDNLPAPPEEGEASDEEDDLRLDDVLWAEPEGWEELDAEKDADARFESIIEELTRELLGRQQAAILAARQQAEEEARKQAEEAAKAEAAAEAETGDEEEDEDEDGDGEDGEGQGNDKGEQEGTNGDAQRSGTEEKDKNGEATQETREDADSTDQRAPEERTLEVREGQPGA